MNPVVILGSARADGHTAAFVDQVASTNIPRIALSSYIVHPYDYAYRHQGDDFLPLIHRILTHDPLIFATPVYWYSMSGQMKVFLDRFADLLKLHRPLAKGFSGLTGYLLVSSASGMPEGFACPFQHTFEYLGMQYGGCASRIWPEKTPEICQRNAAEVAKARQWLNPMN